MLQGREKIGLINTYTAMNFSILGNPFVWETCRRAVQQRSASCSVPVPEVVPQTNLTLSAPQCRTLTPCG